MNDAMSAPQEPLPRPGKPTDLTLREEANAIVAYAFRNGPLEDLHAGRHSTLLEDEGNSRITDAEMKHLMIAACEAVERLLQMKREDLAGYRRFLRDYHARYCSRWER
jgi:hypothetical protein